jgi:hypothetical protein
MRVTSLLVLAGAARIPEHCDIQTVILVRCLTELSRTSKKHIDYSIQREHISTCSCIVYVMYMQSSSCCKRTCST